MNSTSQEISAHTNTTTTSTTSPNVQALVSGVKRPRSLSEDYSDTDGDDLEAADPTASSAARGGPSSAHIAKRRKGDESTMRLGSPKSPNYSNGLSPASSKKSITNGHASAANGASNGTGAVQPSPLPAKWFDHDREEVARILIQSLTDLGYHRSARTLSEESGFELEGPEVAAFRHAVLHGEWAEAEGLLFGHTDSNGGVSLSGNMKGLTLAEGANQKEMLFWLRQQKYLELLENEDVGEALRVLRQELTPLSPANANHVPRLSR